MDLAGRHTTRLDKKTIDSLVIKLQRFLYCLSGEQRRCRSDRYEDAQAGLRLCWLHVKKEGVIKQDSINSIYITIHSAPWYINTTCKLHVYVEKYLSWSMSTKTNPHQKIHSDGIACDCVRYVRSYSAFSACECWTEPLPMHACMFAQVSFLR